MIPNHIHFIFFGFTEFNHIHYLAIKSAKFIHRPEKIFLYYSQEPENNILWQRIKSWVELIKVDPPEEFNGIKLTSYQYKADVLRLQKLIELGGIYLDIDVITLKPFHKLMTNNLVLGIETGDQDLETAESITNAVILTEPNNPFIIEWLEETGKCLENKHWAYHGVNLPVEMLKKGSHNYHLEPKKSFMPFGWRDKWIFESGNKDRLDDSYTIHLWETIWKDDLDKIDHNWIQSSESTLAEMLNLADYKPKIAVYTIAKNEEKFVDRWANSNKEADLRLVCDTGSTDQTIEKLKSHNVQVQSICVLPWRFDTARSTALNLLPADIDICIWQDLDEELHSGWRGLLEQHWYPGIDIINHRFRHNGGNWIWHSKIHTRHGCWWTGAVHETLRWNKQACEIYIDELRLDEHQDVGKSRGSYLPLLLKKIREGDQNWRTRYFLSDEYHRSGDLQQAIITRKESYDLCDEGSDVKAYTARNLARLYVKISDKDNAMRWFKIATDHSNQRENWYALCNYYHQLQDWDSSFICAKRALSDNTPRQGFTYESDAWNSKIYDLAALSSFYLGIKKQAIEWGRRAVELNPNDQRLKKNLEYYEES